MPTKIRVLIAEDVTENRGSIAKLLGNCFKIEVTGQAGTGLEALQLAARVRPDIILLDINLRMMDAITATEKIAREVPEAAIIIMSEQGEQELLHRALTAGAKNYLIKPFGGEALINSVQKAYELHQRLKSVMRSSTHANAQPGKIISVFSSKGGAGKTTIAVNLAVALSERSQSGVAILDANLLFGDVALYLNLAPRATIADAIAEADHLDETTLGTYMTVYNDRLALMAAPSKPELAERITSGQIGVVLAQMKKRYEYVVVDTASDFDEITLAVLDDSDEILVLAGVDLPTIKNLKQCLQIMKSLDYGMDKVHIVLNRANSAGGLSVKQVEQTLNLKFYATIPSDGKTVLPSINKGVPFVLASGDTPVAQNILQLARKLAPQELKPVAKSKESRFFNLFG